MSQHEPITPRSTHPASRATGRVVAIVPARGGSKGVPRKNLAPVGGIPLVLRAVRACQRASSIDDVVVTTDDVEIAQVSAAAGAIVIDRPADLAGDRATSESAILHALAELARAGTAADVVVFVQCTSPFIDAGDLDEAVGKVQQGEYDVVFAAVETFEFLWRSDGDGTVRGLNHDAARRERRQDRQADWRETGAFYVMAAQGLHESQHRFFGRIGPQPVPALTAVEVDDESDLQLARSVEALLRIGEPAWERVELVVTDFDGVHTDDRVLVHQDGSESVIANRSDGHGVKLLREAGVDVVVISTEQNPVVAARCTKLGIECHHGIDRKSLVLETVIEAAGVDADAVVYVGNDVNDLECMASVGIPVAVADAHAAVRAAAVHTLRRAGGAGAVREIAESVIAARVGPTRTGMEQS